MAPHGVPRWSWQTAVVIRRGPKKRLHHAYEEESSREPLKRKRPKHAGYSRAAGSVRRRNYRWNSSAVQKVIASQLQLARRRTKTAPSRPLPNNIPCKWPLGSQVHFRSPVFRERLWSGEFLGFADRRRMFVAIDRSLAMKKSRQLRYIEVVPGIETSVS